MDRNRRQTIGESARTMRMSYHVEQRSSIHLDLFQKFMFIRMNLAISLSAIRQHS